jgi:hypothetical protein
VHTLLELSDEKKGSQKVVDTNRHGDGNDVAGCSGTGSSNRVNDFANGSSASAAARSGPSNLNSNPGASLPSNPAFNADANSNRNQQSQSSFHPRNADTTTRPASGLPVTVQDPPAESTAPHNNISTGVHPSSNIASGSGHHAQNQSSANPSDHQSRIESESTALEEKRRQIETKLQLMSEGGDQVRV